MTYPFKGISRVHHYHFCYEKKSFSYILTKISFWVSQEEENQVGIHFWVKYSFKSVLVHFSVYIFLRIKYELNLKGSVRLLRASIRQGALSLRCFNHRLLPLRWNTTEGLREGEPGEGLQKHSHQSPHPSPNGSPPDPCAFNLLLPAPLSVHMLYVPAWAAEALVSSRYASIISSCVGRQELGEGWPYILVWLTCELSALISYA